MGTSLIVPNVTTTSNKGQNKRKKVGIFTDEVTPGADLEIPDENLEIGKMPQIIGLRKPLPTTPNGGIDFIMAGANLNLQGLPDRRRLTDQYQTNRLLREEVRFL